MKNHIFSIGLLVLLAASCSINEIDYTKPAATEVFYAQFEAPDNNPETKVYATEELYLRWNADDRITIFNKYTYNQEYRFNGETGDNSGSFKRVDNGDFVTGNPLDNIYAIYPYLESTRIGDTGVMTVTLPAEQKYAENTFGLEANTMVSATTDNQLLFKNVGGYLMLKLYGDDVTVSSISLKGNNGEKLSGKATITMPVNGVPTIEMADDAGDEITLVCDTPVKIGTTSEAATTFWLVVPPTVFEKGFTLTVIENLDRVFKKTTSFNSQIKRNTLYRMSSLKVELADVTPDPEDYSSQYLTFEILSDGIIKWQTSVNQPTLSKVIEYSLNGDTWKKISSAYPGASISVVKGDIIRFRGDNESYGVVYDNNSRFLYHILNSSSQFNAYGNIMSLINSTNFKGLTILTGQDNFYGLFSSCSKLKDAFHLVLPATTLTANCYAVMFRDCVNMSSAPDLPATSLAVGCYQDMFIGCSGLKSAPDLPATSLAVRCYNLMFSGCSSLESAPELPAASLAEQCYLGMFNNCVSLTSAPELPARVLERSCYESMFSGCINMQYIKCLATDISATDCTTNWTNNVSSTGVFVEDGSMNTWPSGANGIPTGWTVRASYSENIEMVDLGLSVKWANMNLGATKPEDYGDYYAWGETEPYYSSQDPLTWKEGKEAGYDWASYKWCNHENNKITKYCTKSAWGYNGFTDNKTVLVLNDDTANVCFGGKWRMPSDAEFTELLNNCTWTWTTQNGVNGSLVTGPNGNSIFLPAAGVWSDSLISVDSNGCYWSSSLFTDNPYRAWYVNFYSGGVIRSEGLRYLGCSVRPVYAE